MKFVKFIFLIIIILLLLVCIAMSPQAWIGIIIFFAGYFLNKLYQKGRIQFSKSKYLMALGLISALILAAAFPSATLTKKDNAADLKVSKVAATATVDDSTAEKEAAENAKKKEEAAKLAEQKKLDEAEKAAEQKRLEEEAKKKAEQQKIEEEKKKKEQDAALEAERKRKEQEAAEAEQTTVQTESFANCTELRKVYPDGVDSSHPAYDSKHDRDNDNWACERSR
ncbi:excalibur calcium-binding domain-containing protein [Bacillus infantis]